MTTAAMVDVGRWVVVGFREAKFQACHGAPIQCGATCDRCGQGIMYVVTVRNSATGERLSVGRDCALTLQGGPELAEIRRAERAWQREEWQRINAPRLAAEAHAREAREAAARARARVLFAVEMAECREVIASPNVSDRERALATDLLRDFESGKRTARYNLRRTDSGWCEAEAMAVAVANARAPKARHADVAAGKRATFEATLVRIYHFETAFGTKRIATFRTDDGAILVWKTTAAIGWDYTDSDGFTRWHRVAPLDRVRIVGTVKAHGEYRGQPQTELTRCKVGQ